MSEVKISNRNKKRISARFDTFIIYHSNMHFRRLTPLEIRSESRCLISYAISWLFVYYIWIPFNGNLVATQAQILQILLLERMEMIVVYIVSRYRSHSWQTGKW